MSSKDTGNVSSGCPVDHGKQKNETKATYWQIPFLSSTTAPSVKDAGGGCGCPVKHDDKDPSSPFVLPASIEESAKHSQKPLSDQRIPLSTQRAVSSIPRLPQTENPHHQPTDSPQWVYPSEQQFYNAMRRKGWQGVDERTIPMVVRIHNTVNERGWIQIKEWERELHGCDDPKLVRFLGRPNDLSPRAWISSLKGSRPFDRHDWYVDRGNGQEHRYVIDFYYSNDDDAAGVPQVHLDVRPALDSPEAALDRVQMFVRDAFPGIFSLFHQQPAAPKSDDSKRQES